MAKKLDPIREGERVLEMDQKKGEWPFARFVRLDDGGLGIIVDGNEGGQVVNEGQGIAVIALGKKKARKLREFLERTEP